MHTSSGGAVNSGTFAAKAYCKFQNKIIMDDATFGNRGSFYGRDGKAACMTAHDAPVFKVLDIETIPFKEDAFFFGAGGAFKDANNNITTIQSQNSLWHGNYKI